MELKLGIAGIVLVAGAILWLTGDIIGRRVREKNARKYGRK